MFETGTYLIYCRLDVELVIQQLILRSINGFNWYKVSLEDWDRSE